MKDKIQRITRAMNGLRGSQIHGATKTEKANLGRCEVDPDYKGSFAHINYFIDLTHEKNKRNK